MKLIHENLRKQKGFTLVELLVVIAIIATLAGISIPIGLRVFNSAKETEAIATMKSIETAVARYVSDNNNYPPHAGSSVVTNESHGFGKTANNGGSNMIKILAGENLNGFNERSIDYLKLDTAVDGRNGFLRSSAGAVEGLVDPWGAAYLFGQDYNYDGKITLSWGEFGAIQGEVVAGKAFVVASSGTSRDFNGDTHVKSWE